MLLTDITAVRDAQTTLCKNSVQNPRNPDFCKETKICEEFIQCKVQAHRHLVTGRGALLQMNRSILVEGAFAVLKSKRKFKRFLIRGKTNILWNCFAVLSLRSEKALGQAATRPTEKLSFATEKNILNIQKARLLLLAKPSFAIPFSRDCTGAFNEILTTTFPEWILQKKLA